ncbi:hypothetical protein PPL_10186 [Heterostelium album PN500]|uniref:Major facilitator superfamily protein n=1 Tax=Heterostelium pallidum (strain ATCC 26659 / Pp 5 / PN500) TaxID=670386 RepID=D3BQK1_HETP5|nr:hypothetical protein PPL_10186 [Heterostelium album PN500]EFA76421.1 hypothetical protein PPL_10186 [Heterostelium album PN500]|eukprot:XP_020428553.1 hypothetical protein PPL_10186 [Heterostelium album PN500]
MLFPNRKNWLILILKKLNMIVIEDDISSIDQGNEELESDHDHPHHHQHHKQDQVILVSSQDDHNDETLRIIQSESTDHTQSFQNNNDLEMEELDLKENGDVDGANQRSSNSSFFIVKIFNSIEKEVKYTVHLAVGFLFIFFGFSPTQNLMSVDLLVINIISISSSSSFQNIPKISFLYFPASILVGTAASILWTSQPAYISRAAKNEKELGKYSSIFNSIYTCGGISGNGMSGILNSSGVPITVVLVIFGSVALLGVILVGLVRNIPSKVKEPVLSIKVTLINVFSCFKDRPIQILFPLLILQGLTQGYFFSVIPKLVGLEQTGFVMVMFGVASVVGSSIWGVVHDRLGKKILVVAMLLILPASLLFCALGNYSQRVFLFYAASTLNGAFDSLQNIYIFAIIATIYPTDNISEYSVTRFLQSLCTAVSFFTFGHLTLYVIIPILMTVLLVSTFTQFYLISQHNSNKFKTIKNNNNIDNNDNNIETSIHP